MLKKKTRKRNAYYLLSTEYFAQNVERVIGRIQTRSYYTTERHALRKHNGCGRSKVSQERKNSIDDVFLRDTSDLIIILQHIQTMTYVETLGQIINW